MDIRKSLDDLRSEWETCTACELGQRRFAGDQYLDERRLFVFGEGVRRGVMFIGEGPSKEEEKEGRPFIGRSGMLLRQVLEQQGFTNFYLTNAVACRSCTPVMEADGITPKLKVPWGSKTKIPLPVYKDEPPLPTQMKACQPRLYEEIYLVDPLVIVTLGGKAAQALLGRPVSITRDRGEVEEVTIPGASQIPVLTEKRQQWGRKAQGQYTYPTQQYGVRYLCIPTLHPAYVLRSIRDQKADSPFSQLFKDVKKAISIYRELSHEISGTPSEDEEFEDLRTVAEVQETIAYDPEDDDDYGYE